jgi:hypothetical protein
MLQRSECQVCQGTGVLMVQTSAMWGLLSKTVPSPCGTCAGSGHSLALPACKICQGRGLVGNESEICRSCNGTGHIDSFAMIPLELLHPGTQFHRRCDSCGSGEFEIRSEIKSEKLYKTWDDAEEFRQYELVEKVAVSCTRCPNHYEITIDPAYHKVLDSDTAMELENLGLDLTFLYQAESAQPAVRQEQPQA